MERPVSGGESRTILPLLESIRQRRCHVTARVADCRLMEGLVVEVSQILWHRLRVNNLAHRLPPESFTSAAFAGLQDSAPRAALTALYSRVEHVSSTAWEHPTLVQTWAPRGAVFVVPRCDLAVFALGIVPRDARLRRALEQLAGRARDSIVEVRKDEGRAESDRLGPIPAVVSGQMPRLPIWRLACALAGVQIRWDARSTHLLPSPELKMDEEEARRELARRFLRSLGPAGPRRFTRWAAVNTADAKATFDALADELVAVRWKGGSGFVLAEDVDELARADAVSATRFVAFGGDPVLQPGEDIVAAAQSHRKAALPPWACTGLVLLDSRVVAAWGRSKGRLTILPLTQLNLDDKRRIEAEAHRMPIPGAATETRWREAP